MSPDIIKPGDAARRRREEGSSPSDLNDELTIGAEEENGLEDEGIDFLEEDLPTENSTTDATTGDESLEDDEESEDDTDQEEPTYEDAIEWQDQPDFSPSIPTKSAKAVKARREERPVSSVATTSVLSEESRESLTTRHKREGFYRKLYHGETRIDFVRRKKIWFAISLVVIFAGLISLSTRGLDLGIDFAGGTAWQVRTSTVTPAEARTAIGPLGYGGATITVLGSDSSNKTLQVEAKLGNGSSPNQAQVARVTDALARLAGVNPEAVGVDSVGPSWGSSVTNKAIEALIVFFIVVSLYISIFFEWRMALAAVLAVIHDVMVVVGIYSLTGLQVTPDTVVAILTILGYSLYDTIVVFDRVRDNVSHIGSTGRLSISDIVNLSMNQTLARSINTSLVAILPILSVLILGADILGAQTLQYFGWALLIGLLSGAYSSIFIASPIVAFLKEKEPKYTTIRERLRARGLDRQIYSAAAAATGALASDHVSRSTRVKQTTSDSKSSSLSNQSSAYGRRVPGSARIASDTSSDSHNSSAGSKPAAKPSPSGVYRPKASAKSRRKGRQR